MNTEAEKTGKRYSSYALEYETLFESDHTDDGYINLLLQLMRSGTNLLEIGCGTGRDIKTLLAKGLQVNAIDASEEMVKIAQAKNPSANIMLMDASKLEFPNNTFDGSLSLYVFDHFPTGMYLDALKEAFRVLKPGAPFLLIIHEGDYECESPDLMSPGNTLYRNFKPSSWIKEKIEGIGFEINLLETKDFPDTGVAESTNVECVVIGIKK